MNGDAGLTGRISFVQSGNVRSAYINTQHTWHRLRTCVSDLSGCMYLIHPMDIGNGVKKDDRYLDISRTPKTRNVSERNFDIC